MKIFEFMVRKLSYKVRRMFVDWDTITKYCIANHVHYAIPKYNKDTYSFMVGDVIHLGLQEFTIISLDNGK